MPIAACRPVPVSPILGPGLSGGPSVGRAGNAVRAASGLGNHVERQELAVWPVGREAFDLGVDDARVDPRDLVVIEAESVDGAGRKVLDEDVALGDKRAQQRLAPLVFEVAGHAALVGVEKQEVVGIDPGLIRGEQPPLVAGPWRLDLDDVCSQPCQCLGARGAGFELCQIDDAHTRQGRVGTVGSLHAVFPLLVS